METFTKDEILKIKQSKQLFNVDTLTREQIEFILGRKRAKSFIEVQGKKRKN